jgi:hypothetical protein
MTPRANLAKGYKPHNTDHRAVTISLPPELFEVIREQAFIESRSVSNMITVLLRKALNGNKQ